MAEVCYIAGLNPDVKRRKAVVNQIRANGGYCISQPGRNPNTKCHCEHFRQTCECYCGLFVSIPVTEVENAGNS